MGLLTRKPNQAELTAAVAEAMAMVPDHSSDRNPGVGKSKYGHISYSGNNYSDPQERRDQARGVYQDSLIGMGIVRRLMDSVINTGLTWESSPIWDLIKDGPKDQKAQYAFTRNVENYWKLFSDSKEADIKGLLTLRQLQRLLLKICLIDGEFFLVIRYLSDPRRISPVSFQILNTDQVQTPYDGPIIANIEAIGHKIQDGIEYDGNGQEVAIHVSEGYDKPSKRIPYFSPSGKRRFVIHHANIDAPGQSRGFPELSAFIYELSSLTDFDVAELEATKAAAAFLGAVESELGAKASNKPTFAPATSTRDQGSYAPKQGVESVDIDGKALILNNLPAGYKLHMFQPNRPNQNYEQFVDAHETRICGALGMPLSVYKQQFNSSYSASRTEVLFYWLSVLSRRDDFVSGFLSIFHEIVFTEWVNAGMIQAPGFDDPITRKAWVYGTWNGVARPVVDPVKEANAVKMREALGHTTGEREAKAYNGSDFQENVDRLKVENPDLADANAFLDPSLRPEAVEAVPGEPGKADGIDFDNLKSEFDAYGVGVRAGAITPTPDDENHFRDIAGFPAMTTEAKQYWIDEGGVRRPITLAMPGVLDQDLDSVDEDDDTEDDTSDEASE